MEPSSSTTTSQTTTTTRVMLKVKVNCTGAAVLKLLVPFNTTATVKEAKDCVLARLTTARPAEGPFAVSEMLVDDCVLSNSDICAHVLTDGAEVEVVVTTTSATTSEPSSQSTANTLQRHDTWDASTGCVIVPSGSAHEDHLTVLTLVKGHLVNILVPRDACSQSTTLRRAVFDALSQKAGDGEMSGVSPASIILFDEHARILAGPDSLPQLTASCIYAYIPHHDPETALPSFASSSATTASATYPSKPAAASLSASIHSVTSDVLEAAHTASLQLPQTKTGISTFASTLYMLTRPLNSLARKHFEQALIQVTGGFAPCLALLRALESNSAVSDFSLTLFMDVVIVACRRVLLASTSDAAQPKGDGVTPMPNYLGPATPDTHLLEMFIPVAAYMVLVSRKEGPINGASAENPSAFATTAKPWSFQGFCMSDICQTLRDATPPAWFGLALSESSVTAPSNDEAVTDATLVFPFQLHHPLDMRSQQGPYLVFHMTGEVAVFHGLDPRTKFCRIFDSATGWSTSHEPDEVAVAVRAMIDASPLIPHHSTAQCTEAVMVLVDTSSSMSAIWEAGAVNCTSDTFEEGQAVEVNRYGTSWYPGVVTEQVDVNEYRIAMDSGSTTTAKARELRRRENHTRLGVAVELMTILSCKIKAGDLPTSVGLLLFASSATQVMHLSRYLQEFETELEEAKPNGCTALFDTIILACQRLTEFQLENPEARLRIVCLTDGEDTASQSRAQAALKEALACNVTVDSILIGGTSNADLKSISTATGGYCFNPQSMEQATDTFEFETMLELAKRGVVQGIPEAATDPALFSSLANTSQFPYTVSPEFVDARAQGRRTATVEDVMKRLKERAERQASATRQSSTSSCTKSPATTQPASGSGASGAVLRRLMKELSEFTSNPLDTIGVYPSDDLQFWSLVIQAPDDSAYKGGCFRVSVSFPGTYPFQPPSVRFITKTFHPNINTSGQLCLDVLRSSWSPALSIRKVALIIQSLFSSPNFDDPLRTNVTELYYADRADFEKQVAAHVKEHASKSFDEWKAELS
eukprot:m.6989 g.6989  ORF g.6989 m.6989 type:complete len:1042 (-) comp5209_c0_seq1:191-3316(-)